jgi:hypothetical protein
MTAREEFLEKWPQSKSILTAPNLKVLHDLVMETLEDIYGSQTCSEFLDLTILSEFAFHGNSMQRYYVWSVGSHTSETEDSGEIYRTLSSMWARRHGPRARR